MHKSIKYFKDRLLEFRRISGLTQKGLSKLSGIPQPMISRYERGEAEPVSSNIIKIAKALNISLDWLMTGEGGMYKGHKFCEPCAVYKIKESIPGKIPVRPVPVLNTVPAGFPETPIDDNIIDWVLIPMDLKDSKAFALVVSGKSMYPKIDEGEIVVISPKTRVTSGQIGAFRINNDVTIKRLLVKDGKTYLISENTDYPPIILKDGDELEAIGLTVYQVKKIQ